MHAGWKQQKAPPTGRRLDCTETRWPQLLVLQPAAAPSQDGAGWGPEGWQPLGRQDSLGSRLRCRTGHPFLGTPLLPPGLRRSLPLPPRSLPCSGSDLPGLWRLLQPLPTPSHLPACLALAPLRVLHVCSLRVIQSCCGTRSSRPVLHPCLGALESPGGSRSHNTGLRGTSSLDTICSFLPGTFFLLAPLTRVVFMSLLLEDYAGSRLRRLNPGRSLTQAPPAPALWP